MVMLNRSGFVGLPASGNPPFLLFDPPGAAGRWADFQLRQPFPLRTIKSNVSDLASRAPTEAPTWPVGCARPTVPSEGLQPTFRRPTFRRCPIFKILQRGVQRKQGVVVHIIRKAVSLHNATPIRCTPLRLHPPVVNTQNRSRLSRADSLRQLDSIRNSCRRLWTCPRVWLSARLPVDTTTTTTTTTATSDATTTTTTNNDHKPNYHYRVLLLFLASLLLLLLLLISLKSSLMLLSLVLIRFSLLILTRSGSPYPGGATCPALLV